jgi:solute:Na+ symporter, SSS family
MKRLNHHGCLAALVVGFALGVIRLVVDTPVALRLTGFENGYTPGSLLWIVNNINFQYYSLIIFLVSVVVMVAVSYATAPPPLEKLNGLTFATVSREDRNRSRRSWNRWDVAASAIILLIILAAYLYFNG